MVIFDANFLIYFLDPKIKGGVGSNPRIDHLVATIQKTGERIVVPTPALSELLVKAGCRTEVSGDRRSVKILPSCRVRRACSCRSGCPDTRSN
jgi:predicted nucleic acid-binding protein